LPNLRLRQVIKTRGWWAACPNAYEKTIILKEKISAQNLRIKPTR
jgi:hypothetical protein